MRESWSARTRKLRTPPENASPQKDQLTELDGREERSTDLAKDIGAAYSADMRRCRRRILKLQQFTDEPALNFLHVLPHTEGEVHDIRLLIGLDPHFLGAGTMNMNKVHK